MSEKVIVGGQVVDRFSRDGLAAQLLEDKNHGVPAPRLVFSVNGQGLSMAASNPTFAADMAKADIRHADGQSIVLASKVLTKAPLPERIATTDFFHDAARVAETNGMSFFFLGGTEEAGRRAYDNARAMYPNVNWVGFRNGYFSEQEEPEICRQIVAAGTDVLWVGTGRPRQEAFCVRNQHRLAGVTWLKTCGGLFNFLAGDNSRAPEWMQSAGLEWLYRTILEPRRLLWRYLTTNTHSIWLFATKSGHLPKSQEQ